MTVQEYESRLDRYDKQLQELLNIDVKAVSTEEKVSILKKYREEQYQKLQDAVYKKRGWNSNGCPTLGKIQEIGIDYPDVIEVISKFQ